MLVIRCVHCEHYNSKYCKRCFKSEIPFIAYKERIKKVISDISYENIENKLLMEIKIKGETL